MEDGDRSNIQDNSLEKWTYKNYLREYLLLIARKGRIAIESAKNFPERIELSGEWHEMLNVIRKGTLDGKERLALIGVREERTSLLLPTIPAVGYDRCIPSELTAMEEQKARDKFGIVDIVGDVHSHPITFTEKLHQKFPVSNTLGLKARFSAGDYYCMVSPNRPRFFMGLVEGDYNLFMFRVREMSGLGIDSHIFSQESFERYWYEKFGYKYLGNIDKEGANRVVAIQGKADLFNMNKAILERHMLVLYQGAAGRDLVKIYPKKNF